MRKITFLLFSLAFAILPHSLLAQSSNTVDILWQGEGYVPAFYEGRTPWTRQTRITLYAVPSISGLTNAASLNYRWSKNGEVLGNASGVGRNSLYFIDTILSNPATIKVDVFSSGGALLATNSVTVTPRAPELAIYEQNPLLGYMFHKEAGGSYSLDESEVTFSAFPLFYAVTTKADPNLSYEWRTNAGVTEERSSVTYRAPEGEEGSSQVNVRVKNAEEIMQDLRRSFLVEYGENDEI